MKKATIFYFYDALCGWCYGFSPVFKEFYEKHKENYQFQVVSGGMITGTQAGPIGKVAGYIKEAYKTVENRTGVKFGEAFLKDILEEGSTEFNSIPLGVAMTVFKKYQPENQVLFANRLQQAVYYDGIAPMEESYYGPIAEEFSLDGNKFISEMKEEINVKATFEEFSMCKRLGVQGYPTVAIETGEGKLYALSRGYLRLEDLEANFEDILAV